MNNGNIIEPSLTTLLNDAGPDNYTSIPSLELPPLQDPNILKASGRPLLLEPNAINRDDKPADSKLASARAALIAPKACEDKCPQTEDLKPARARTDRTLGDSSPQSLRKILGDARGDAVASTKKREHDTSKDDFVQLPPPKKQRTANQLVPPIIIGLFEPPPQSTLFPPIASSSFHDSHGRNSLNTVPPKVKAPENIPTIELVPGATREKTTHSGLQKRRSTNVRKKWSEEETNTLLLGVAKHGVGNWTDIIKDSSFSFNERSALDLKDRFRTCCPEELRSKGCKSKTSITTSEMKPSKSSLMSENILINPESGDGGSITIEGKENKVRKSRAHRRKMEDLAQLGIANPFRKSIRRERKPYTEEEDRAILKGYNALGPSWSRIQRDPLYKLQHRQPTDIRDRFRNRYLYPEKFRAELNGKSDQSSSSNKSYNIGNAKDTLINNLPSGGMQHPAQELEKVHLFAGKDALGSLTRPLSFQPLANRDGLRIQEIISTEQELSKSMPMQSQSSIFSFSGTFGEQPQMDPNDPLPFIQSFEWAPGLSAPFSNEMDISRLLLDDTWPEIPIQTGKERQHFSDSGNILPSNSESLHNLPSFLNMLNDPDPDSEHIDNLNDNPF